VEAVVEATCAALVSSGACDFAASKDFDTLLFGSLRVLSRIDLCYDRPSACEFCDAVIIDRMAGLDRGALVAAAFLMGCDHDRRRNSADREGSGVRGMGPKQAVGAARELRVAGEGDALQALRNMLTERSAGNVGKVTVSKLLCRAKMKAMSEKGCVDGLNAVVKQYYRSTNLSGQIPFVWIGAEEDACYAALKGVFKSSTLSGKLQPLLFEWTLRSIASNCPPTSKMNGHERRIWAYAKGLRYVPLSAKCTKVTSERSPHALVEWAHAEGAFDEASILKLSPAIRRTRVSLARACFLLASQTSVIEDTDILDGASQSMASTPPRKRQSARITREESLCKVTPKRRRWSASVFKHCAPVTASLG